MPKPLVSHVELQEGLPAANVYQSLSTRSASRTWPQLLKSSLHSSAAFVHPLCLSRETRSTAPWRHDAFCGLVY